MTILFLSYVKKRTLYKGIGGGGVGAFLINKQERFCSKMYKNYLIKVTVVKIVGLLILFGKLAVFNFN